NHTSPFITQCYRCDDQEEEERRQEGSQEGRQVGGRGGMKAFRKMVFELAESIRRHLCSIGSWKELTGKREREEEEEEKRRSER
ncbi:hypothetical protein NQZ68_023093, partial [Dissostichus eleginoides]